MQPTKQRPQLEYVSPHSLQPHRDNPRTHPRKQIANSIKAYDFRSVVLVDEHSRIIVGHARVEACKLLGITEIPVLRINDLTDEQIRGLMIVDNKLTDNSKWDDQLLGQNLKILTEHDLDIGLDELGFENGEVEFYINQFEIAVESGPSSEESDPEIPELDQVQAVSQQGDCWVADGHRIACGDSTRAETYEDLLGDEQASTVVTDPPFNLPARDIGKVCAEAHGDFAMAAGEMTQKQFTAFLESVMVLLCQFSVPGSIHYLFMDWRHAAEILAAGRVHYSEFKNLCVWAKNRAGMGSFYRSQHELVFVFKNGDAPHQNHFKLGQFGRNRSNVWQFPGVRQFQSKDGDPDGNEALQLHPTVKPVKLIEEALLDCSRRGEIVLDPFIGSGSTLIAAEKVRRRCFGIELEPRYVDVAIHRWQAWTGKDAVHEATGLTYREIAANRTASVVTQGGKSNGE